MIRDQFKGYNAEDTFRLLINEVKNELVQPNKNRVYSLVCFGDACATTLLRSVTEITMYNVLAPRELAPLPQAEDAKLDELLKKHFSIFLVAEPILEVDAHVDDLLTRMSVYEVHSIVLRFFRGKNDLQLRS